MTKYVVDKTTGSLVEKRSPVDTVELFSAPDQPDWCKWYWDMMQDVDLIMSGYEPKNRKVS